MKVSGYLGVSLLLLLLPAHVLAADMEISPFRTVNQNPLSLVRALPSDSSSQITPKGHLSSTLVYDLASNYRRSVASQESLLLDGESDRWTLSAQYGVTDSVEVGIEIPYMVYGGGFLDSFIINWHDRFGMPQGGRDTAPRDRIKYSYSKSGAQQLRLDSSGSGFGDIVLSAGLKLSEKRTEVRHDTLALRMTVKLPSGDAGELLGDGAVGGSISLCGASNLFTEYGAIGVFGSAGGMFSDKGDILREQQEPLAAFGTFGLGWGPSSWISFKVQLHVNSRLYSDSSLDEISSPAFMLVSGGTLKLPGDYFLDIGVSEDVSVGTAPDAALHLALSKTF